MSPHAAGAASAAAPRCHQAQAEHRDDADRPGAAVRDRRAVERQPASGQIANRPVPIQHERVSIAPAPIAGKNASANIRPAAPASGVPERRALSTMAAEPDRGRDHRDGEPDGQPISVKRFGMSAQRRPRARSDPISTPPQPGTAVNPAARLHRRVDEPEVFGCLFVPRRTSSDDFVSSSQAPSDCASAPEGGPEGPSTTQELAQSRQEGAGYDPKKTGRSLSIL